jgi:exopolysaccharide biosynthesis WecB/TagA/CpsF family protein
MKVAFLGSRGIPRCYSGFETFVEEVAVRLVARGHEVTVYNRIPFNPYREAEFRGVKIVHLPTIPTKEADSFVHSLLSTAHSLGSRFDVVYFCGVGNGIFARIASWRGASTIINVDGADWKRAKWTGFARYWLRWSESQAGRSADAVIADHPIIQERYREEFGTECELISYGADVVTEDPGQAALQKFGLRPGEYLLYVSRLTPENAADLAMEAYLETTMRWPLVVVGDDKYLHAYQRKLHQLAAQAPGKIILTGYQFGETYRQLSFHARAFIFPSTIEATRPVMLEQMGMGACMVALDTSSNRHVLGGAAVWFGKDEPSVPTGGETEAERRSALVWKPALVCSLAGAMEAVSGDTFDRVEMARSARERVRTRYSWDLVTDQYEELFGRMRPGRSRGTSCEGRGSSVEGRVAGEGKAPGTVSVLGTPLLVASYDSLQALLLEKAVAKEKTTVDFANTHVITMRKRDALFAARAKMDLILPDGMPLVWVMNARGAGLEDRVYGPTFTRLFLEKCPAQFSHYFMGGDQTCGDALIERLRGVNPHLNVVGRFHGWCDREGHLGEADAAVLAELREKQPDFLWVGLGTPKQYAWIHRMVDELDRGIFLSVGFAFDVNAGTKPDAPAWMQKRGLTWLYRLCTEPRRLLPRYVKYNSLFLWYLAREVLAQRSRLGN